jgi:hypothetical protein
MSKFLTVICILALVALIAAPAFAEVQNVKVSGDITVRNITRNDYALSTAATQNYFMQTVGLNVDADLTDNVSTAVRIINQRDWNNNNATLASQSFPVDLDLAYVTLKEMVYAPLTLTIGRQDLWFGKGLIVGANLPAATANTLTAGGSYNNINAKEYSELTGFDALRATLDLAPWKLDMIYSVIGSKSLPIAAQNVQLYGANLGYKFDVYNGEAEAYYFGKTDNADPDLAGMQGKIQVNTLGLRGSLEPITNLTLGAEGALQGGKYADKFADERSIRAYAYDLYGKYNFANVTWKPTLSLEWLSLSGEADTTDSTGSSKWHGWNPMFRGKFDNSIRDFQNYLYATTERAAITSNGSSNQDNALSNQNSLMVKGSIKPVKDVTVEGTYSYFWLNKEFNSANIGTLGTSKKIGQEVDMLLTYDYTQDVSFGLLGGLFLPGSEFKAPNKHTASDVVGTMKVVF